eukprot:Skav232485  [mRNA]  locus=scaffold2877:302702:308606:+ [translate_table: standard]
MSAHPQPKARAGDEEVARKRLFRGTRLCYACKFAHSQDELRPSYISKAKSNRSPGPSQQMQAPAATTSEGQDQTAQLQGFPPTQAGLLHSAALYTLLLQGLNPPGSSPQGMPDSPVRVGRVLSASPKAEKSAAWSRQTTADVGDDAVRAFSRQTTEEPQSSSALFRQVTDEARRPLPLSQLLSLPEPDERSESQDATDPDHPDRSSANAALESREEVSPTSPGSGREELQVSLKNTFLHWEPVPGPDHVISLRRSRSLPISLPEDAAASVDVRN